MRQLTRNACGSVESERTLQWVYWWGNFPNCTNSWIFLSGVEWQSTCDPCPSRSLLESSQLHITSLDNDLVYLPFVKNSEGSHGEGDMEWLKLFCSQSGEAMRLLSGSGWATSLHFWSQCSLSVGGISLEMKQGPGYPLTQPLA